MAEQALRCRHPDHAGDHTCSSGLDLLIALHGPLGLNVAVSSAQLPRIAPRSLLLRLGLKEYLRVRCSPSLHNRRGLPLLALMVIGLVGVPEEDVRVALDVEQRTTCNTEVEVLGDTVARTLIGASDAH